MRWQRVAAGGCGAALMIIVSMGWVSYRNTSALIEAARRVAHMHQALTELEAMLSTITEAETSRQGYVIAGEARHLEPYHAAVAEVDGTLERLRHLTADNPNQQQRISTLKSLLDEKVAQWQHSIDLQQAEGLHPEAQIALTDEGKALMDQLRWVIETMKAEEGAWLIQRNEQAQARARGTYVTILLGIGLSFVMLSLALYLFMREIAERARVEAELRATKDAVEGATRVKSELLANMGHEIRTPMNAIIGMTELLLATTLTPEQREYAETIRNGGEALLAIINCTMIAGSDPLHSPAPTEDVGTLAGRHLLIVDDDATNRQIIAQLAVSLGMKPQSVASGAEALALISQGVPLDLAILDMRMAEMDGLALAREIRRSRTPSELPLIMLTSAGVGTDDTIASQAALAAWLNKPIKPAQLAKTLIDVLGQTRQRGPSPASSSVIDRQLAARLPLRILIAEDNPMNQKVALHMLAQMGYRADVAGNGREVIEALERQPYDIVLMDIQMPELDGLETTHRIRQQWPDDARPRIIAVTANTMQGDREQCLAAGMDGYIGKPVRIGELQVALVRWGETVRRQVARRAEAPAPDEEFAPLTQLRAMQQEGESDIVTELIDIFLEDTPPWLDALHHALREADPQALDRAGHSLRGSCAMIGAQRMADLCAEVQRKARANALAGAEAMLTDLESEFARIRRILERKRQRS
jgi:CheY-like chemotaxis protein/CHASE3 domain sensor protein